MDCIYIAPLSKALYNLCLSFTHSHTHSHTNGDWLHARYQPARQEQLGVRCLAQGHFDTPRVGSNRQPSDCQMTALTSWAISPLYHFFVLLSSKASLFFASFAGDSRDQRYYVLGFSVYPSVVHPSVHPSAPFVWTRYLRNMREFLKIWQKHRLGLKHKLIVFWWSKVKVIVSSHPSNYHKCGLRNAWRGFHCNWHKCRLGLKDELIRIWWSKVTVAVTSQKTFGCNSRSHTLIMQNVT